MSGQDPDLTSPSNPAGAAPKLSLPPGFILDKDGKPCKICNTRQAWRDAMKGVTKPSGGQGSSSGAGAGAGSSGRAGNKAAGGMAALFGAAAGSSAKAATTAEQALPTSTDHDHSQCPPDVEQLGRSTWTFLHTTAAYYPLRASPTQQSSMLSLLSSLSLHYPCTYCASDFQERIEAVKPDVSGREGLSRWLCDRHNEVNERLGKGVFDCGTVGERWRDGPKDGSCD